MVLAYPGNVTVSGTGWYPFDSITVYLISGTGGYSPQIGTIHADASGAISGQTMQVSVYAAAGKYTLLATDNQVTIGVPVTINPNLVVTTTSNTPAGGASAGTTLNLAGYGFAANSKITSATLGTTNVPLTTSSPPLTTSGYGYFQSTTFVVPKIGHGTYPLKVKDAAGDVATVSLAVV
jgi:hypothetical protein